MYTSELKQTREDLKEQILDDYNETFDTDLLEFDDIPEKDTEEYEEFKDYWENEYEQISDIDEIEDQMGPDFEYDTYLIPEDEFDEDYVREMLEDIGYISKDFPWWIEIDWSKTADNVRTDYSEIEYNGTTYLYR